MTEEEFIPRIKWSEFEYNHPLRIIIKDWKNLQIFHKRYMIVPSAMEYRNRSIELCVPYDLFVRKLRKLPLTEQKWIINGKAVIEIEKTYRHIDYGMRINKVEKIDIG